VPPEPGASDRSFAVQESPDLPGPNGSNVGASPDGTAEGAEDNSVGLEALPQRLVVGDVAFDQRLEFDSNPPRSKSVT
jgi:hypothetical protein